VNLIYNYNYLNQIIPFQNNVFRIQKLEYSILNIMTHLRELKCIILMMMRTKFTYEFTGSADWKVPPAKESGESKEN
jgi:hypothetical protein